MDQIERFAIFPADVMRILQAVQNQRGNAHSLMNWQLELVLVRKIEKVAQVHAGNELHREKQRIIHQADLIDADDVRMMQGHADSGFVNEHADEILLSRQARQYPLDRHDFACAQVFRAEDFRHAADIDAIQNLKLCAFRFHISVFERE